MSRFSYRSPATALSAEHALSRDANTMRDAGAHASCDNLLDAPPAALAATRTTAIPRIGSNARNGRGPETNGAVRLT